MVYRICSIPDGGNPPIETVEVSQEYIDAVNKLLLLHAQEQEGIVSGRPTPSEWANAVEAIHGLSQN